MTNTMPMLTDEQRDSLYDDLQYWVKTPMPGHSDQVRLAFQIALAALTAEPEELPSIFDAFKAETEWQKGFLAGQKEYMDDLADIGPFYTAPPVPALKLPGISELIDLSGGCMPNVRDVTLWDACIKEVKRLNGAS